MSNPQRFIDPDGMEAYSVLGEVKLGTPEPEDPTEKSVVNGEESSPGTAVASRFPMFPGEEDPLGKVGMYPQYGFIPCICQENKDGKIYEGTTLDPVTVTASRLSVKNPVISLFEVNGMPGGITLPPIGIFVHKNASMGLKQHEYGHFIQYQELGFWNFYKNIGLPSLYNAVENSFESSVFGRPVFSVPHSKYRTETDANKKAIDFFGASISNNFQRSYPTTTLSTPYTWAQRLSIYSSILFPKHFP